MPYLRAEYPVNVRSRVALHLTLIETQLENQVYRLEPTCGISLFKQLGQFYRKAVKSLDRSIADS